MLQCGFVRANFSLAILAYSFCARSVVAPVSFALLPLGPGAGEGNRTPVFSLEGCCSTIELHPPNPQPLTLDLRPDVPHQTSSPASRSYSLRLRSSSFPQLVGEVG